MIFKSLLNSGCHAMFGKDKHFVSDFEPEKHFIPRR